MQSPSKPGVLCVCTGRGGGEGEVCEEVTSSLTVSTAVELPLVRGTIVVNYWLEGLYPEPDPLSLISGLWSNTEHM